VAGKPKIIKPPNSARGPKMTLPIRKFCPQIKPGAIIPPPRILEQLIEGYAMLDDHANPDLPDDKLKPYWKKSQDFIMGLVGQDVQKIVPEFFFSEIPVPWGSRPWAWWRFTAKEPRRLLSGDPAMVLPKGGLFFGVPRLYRQANHNCRFESEFQYLKRLNLLLPMEEN
jgi:hypothetical protein